MMETGGQLAAALAKAQIAFAPVKRDKTVTVQSQRTGKSYTFAYAPLDTILEAVRKPLADNGLVVVQMLDDDDLVTSLLHESGAVLSGRVSLPRTDDIQGFGSAITYLRRYAIQALLGIAAEDDDDGNRAAGNVAQPIVTAPPITTTDDGGLIGEAITQGTQDLQLRQTTSGAMLPFRVKQGRSSVIVAAEGGLAEALDEAIKAFPMLGKRVIVWGHFSDESFADKKSGRTVNYRVLHLERIQTPDFTLPAPEAESVGMFDVAPLTEDEREAIAGGVA